MIGAVVNQGGVALIPRKIANGHVGKTILALSMPTKCVTGTVIVTGNVAMDGHAVETMMEAMMIETGEGRGDALPIATTAGMTAVAVVERRDQRLQSYNTNAQFVKRCSPQS